MTQFETKQCAFKKLKKPVSLRCLNEMIQEIIVSECYEQDPSNRENLSNQNWQFDENQSPIESTK